MGRGKDTKRKADQIAGIRNVAEGHEGASWHVGKWARWQGEIQVPEVNALGVWG